MTRLVPGLAALLLCPGPLVSQPAVPETEDSTGRRGMVVCTEPRATDAGVEVMQKGGTAIDGAVAVGFALAVLWPSAGNLGGGGFMVIHLADGREVAVDYREKAPAAATRDMYLGEDGRPVAERSRQGHLAVAVPGSVAGLCHVQAAYGSRPLAEVLAPAMRLARRGFSLSRHQVAALKGSAALLETHPESRRIFLNGGASWVEGQVFRQPELAQVLERIAAAGRDGFYRGQTAELLVAEMKRGGGLITLEDLASYEVKEREPVRGSYRGHEIVAMPPPSSGGPALIQMLNILEGYPLDAPGFPQERRLHLLAESMRLAFRDRARYLGDPDFSSVPTRGLVAKPYASQLRSGIKEKAAGGDLATVPDPFAWEKEETTHYSVMDASGAAVACTTTLNGSFGCGVTVTGAGFLLNNEMDDFAAAPGTPNMFDLIQGEANAVGPRKRPLSSMTPTLVKKEDQVLLVIGSPGGPTIINTVLQCVLHVLDEGMDIGAAIAAPRLHHQWVPDVLVHEKEALTPELSQALRQRGHHLKVRATMGDAHGIYRDPQSGRLTGAADPRHGGKARGF